MPSKAKARPKGVPRLPSRVSRILVNELLVALEGDNGPKGKYLKEEMLSKYLDPTVTSPKIRAQAAVQKWMVAEQRNLATNYRLMHANASNPDFGWTSWDRFTSCCRSLIARVLGPIPSLTSHGQMSNGASTRVNRGNTAALLKLKGECHTSPLACNLFDGFWADVQFPKPGRTRQETSTMFTVVKKSDIDRVACKEPEGNMLLQRIVGDHIRTRLRRKAGINLRDQTRNQKLAREGSLKGRLATIDLSSASDTISRQLVITLLPAEWWSLLDDIRVHRTLIPDRYLKEKTLPHDHELEMFSSMGNGFTFELESLLFWAITMTVQRLSKGEKGVVSVYGDDIICLSRLVPRLNRMFNFLGFTMNTKKTNYGPGNPFRESCGRHYYNGFDVSPFYIREEVRTMSHLIKLLNQLLEWDGRNLGFFESELLASYHRRWSKLVPHRLRGGVDTDETTALVDGSHPKDCIVDVTRPIDISFFEQERYLLYWMDSERLGKCPYEASIRPSRREKRGFTVQTTQPVRRVGETIRPHPEKGTGQRTTWRPYLIWP